MKKAVLKKKIEALKVSFHAFFKEEPTDVFSSPGRIELIGNHTDHNHGLVMVSSVDLSITAVSKKTDDEIVFYHTKGFPDMKVNLNDLDKKDEEVSTSIGMIRGVLFKMKSLGYKVGGVKVITSTTIFKGAGVSSSAAFELLICQIMNHYYNNDSIDAYTLAKIAQFSECEYFGKPCGLLDQSGIALGGVNYIDFNNPETPIIKHLVLSLKYYDIVLVNTKDSHAKLTPLYAKIKDDMFSIAHMFNKEYLRDVDENMFYAKQGEIKAKLGEDVYLRGKHYFEENRRVLEAFEAISKGDEKTFVNKLNESGESSFYQLKNCYVKDVNENLPSAILESKSLIKDGCVRVHGGGFAGTILAFVRKNEVTSYVNKMKERFGPRNVKKVSFDPYGARYVGRIEEVIK